MDERNLAIASRRSQYTLRLDHWGPEQRVGHETRRLHKGKGNAAGPNGGFALCMPDARSHVLPGIHRGKFHEALNAYRFCDLSSNRVPPDQLGAAIQEKKNIDPCERGAESCRIAQISSSDVDAIAIKAASLGKITNENPWTDVALEELFHEPGSDFAGGTSDEVSHKFSPEAGSKCEHCS